MSDESSIVLSREQLYKEIWEITVAGVAKKYNVPYNHLLNQCKTADIPIPPSGYWVKLSFGKKVVQPPLPDSPISEVAISAVLKPKIKNTFAIVVKKKAVLPQENNLTVEHDDQQEDEMGEAKELIKHPAANEEKQEPYHLVFGKSNTYNRDKLYKEVWEKPVVEVAVQYGVSDVAIHKVCKSLNVPVPPRGYWAKVRAGAKLPKTPLPPSNGFIMTSGARTFEGFKEAAERLGPLAFLPEDERQKVLIAAQQIRMPDANAQLHKKINAYRPVIREWDMKDPKDQNAQKTFSTYYYSSLPFLAGVISKAALPRVFLILDALFRQVEGLGGNVNDDLSLQVRNEHITLEIAEAQDQVNHVLSKEEARAIIEYEDAKKHHTWASQPNIRKYDYVFNGKLRICIRQGRYFRDTEKVNIESRLGDILIELYEESEAVRIKRVEREEAERKRQEEARLREERRERYNKEVERTIALTNAAQDYQTACNIRAYVSAVESTDNYNSNDKTAAWIEWAKKKADWFDPTVARADELFGIRRHEKSKDEKAIKEKNY